MAYRSAPGCGGLSLHHGRGTFEEKVNEMLKKKRELADLAVGVGESWIGDLTDDEIKSIFSLSSSGI